MFRPKHGNEVSRVALSAFFLATLLTTFLGTSPASAQMEPKRTNVFLGIHFQMVFPQGDFKEKVDNLGFGLNGDIGYDFPGWPIAVGFQGGYVVYGSETYRTPLSGTIPINVEVTATNSIVPLHVFLRLIPPKGDVRPYFEGLAGLNIFTTSMSAKNLNNNEEIAGETKNTDAAFSYGGSGGVLVRVWSGTTVDRKDASEQALTVYIDARVRYLYGGNVSYYTESAVYRVGDVVRFDENRITTSKTDYITGQIGLVVRF
ncbi:MAG: hypothetical protein QHI48_01905 [Bacteroidota bacterium]|nr:hypothetical protein [Bacteroidota bacterium]